MLIPTIIEKKHGSEVAYDLYSRLLQDRIILLNGEINDQTANIVVSELLYLDSLENNDISIYINSPGGSVSAGLAIYDTINYIKSDVNTICLGIAASMAAVILSSGSKGKRYCLPNSEIMIHQPLGGVEGQATEIKIAAEHILKTKDKINKILSQNTNQNIKKIENDTERDNFMSAYEALNYGLVDKIIDKSGNVVKTAETTIKRQVISGETSELMRGITETIVNSNGGQNAYIAGYRIGGKSGTSQKLDEYSNYNMRYVGSFCAFTPANDPEYIMLVCVDEPLGGKYYGSMVAAPVVSAVFSECLEYLGVYPQYTADELEMQSIAVPYVYGSSKLDAITKINASAGLKYEIIGEDASNIVDYTVPEASALIPRNGTVVIYMQGAERNDVTVPDLTGYTVDQVNNILTSKGLNVSLSGGAVNNSNATASSQSVEAGSVVPKGTVVSVTFLVTDSDAG